MDLPTEEQIEIAAKNWKKMLGMDVTRLKADKDFQAGATVILAWFAGNKELLNNLLEEPVK